MDDSPAGRMVGTARSKAICRRGRLIALVTLTGGLLVSAPAQAAGPPNLQATPAGRALSAIAKAPAAANLVNPTPATRAATNSPLVDLPSIATPSVELPAVKTPVAEAPAVKTPVAEVPAVKIPVAEAPAVKTPVIRTRHIELPGPAHPTPKPAGPPATSGTVTASPASNGRASVGALPPSGARTIGASSTSGAPLETHRHTDLRANSAKASARAAAAPVGSAAGAAASVAPAVKLAPTPAVYLPPATTSGAPTRHAPAAPRRAPFGLSLTLAPGELVLALIAALLGSALVALMFADNVGLGPRNAPWRRRTMQRLSHVPRRSLASAGSIAVRARMRVPGSATHRARRAAG